MGHAGAIVSGSSGTAEAKKEALEAAGVKVGKTPSETARLLREIYQGSSSESGVSPVADAAEIVKEKSEGLLDKVKGVFKK